jgi:electron transfer flavoprotein beta subunit
MANVLHIVVCAGIVPDPLQTLEPITTPNGPGLKNEMVLPAVLDPWAASALYEAANLAAKNPGSKLWLVSLGPKAKLQQVMMTVAQKVAFELVPIDGPIGGFPDAHSTAAVLAETIAALPALDRSEAPTLRRLGIGHARRRRHAAIDRRAPRHHRSIPGRRPDQSPRRRQL